MIVSETPYLSGGVVDVIPVPITWRNFTGEIMLLWNKRKEPSSSLRVARVHGRNIQVLHTLSFSNQPFEIKLKF